MALTQFYSRSTGRPLDLAEEIAFGSAEEARTYRLRDDATRVARLYSRPSPELGAKLSAMVAQRPADPGAAFGHVAIAWPVDLVEMGGTGGPVAGFLLPFVPGLRPFPQASDPAARLRTLPLFTQRHRHRAARNLTAAVAALHANGTVLGCLDEGNVLVTDTALVTLLGAEAFQVRDPVGGKVYPAGSAQPEMTPPELQVRFPGALLHAPEDDLFGLGVLLFRLLMEGHHPFDGEPIGVGGVLGTLAERIAAGPFPYSVGISPLRPPRTAPPFQVLSPALQTLFRDCFEAGFRDPAKRPKAAAWLAALAEAERSLIPCVVNPQHVYGRHLSACPWCARTAAARAAGAVLPGAAGGAGSLSGPARESFRPPPPVSSGPAPMLRESKNLLAGCLVAGGITLLLFFGYVFSFVRRSTVPLSGPVAVEEPADPETQVALAQLQKRLTNPAIPGGCDPLARSAARRLSQVKTARNGAYLLQKMLDKEVSYRTFDQHESLDASCMSDYLQGLAAQAPNSNWKYSPFATGGMEALVALVERVNRGELDENDPTLSSLTSLGPYCPSDGRCETQLVPEAVESSTATQLVLHGTVRMRRDLREWTRYGSFRKQLEWDGKSWSAMESSGRVLRSRPSS